ncbi:MAG TPA: hypothetical protein VMK53_09100 [Gemmatimonadales bacterium]|nr:hypothetical protein [Gemmatimonadales bacterium]
MVHPRFIACALVLACLPARLVCQDEVGQRSIALTGHAGLLLPSADLFQDGILGGGWRQDGGWQVGGGVVVPLFGRVAAQVVFGRGSTGLEGYGENSWEGFSGGSRLLELSGRLMVRVTPKSRTVSVSLLAGGGMLWQSFDSPQQNWLGVAGLQSRAWPTAVGGIRGRFRLNHQLSMTTTVEQHFYTAKFTGSLASEIAQRDTRISLGLYLPLGWQ